MIDVLERNGITPPTEGRAKTTCPECSEYRRKRNDRCMKVWTYDDLVFWHCYHCKWESSDVII